MTYEEFVTEIKTVVAVCPKEWRRGQSVFNIVEERFRVAHEVQANGLDCFYDDSKIEAFLREAWCFVKKNG